MQNVRNRLIELLETDIECNSGGHGDCAMCEYHYTDEGCVRHISEQTTDLLLNSGVVVFPCKLGDYITRNGDAYPILWRVDAIHYYREGQPTITATHNNVTMTATFDGIGAVYAKEEVEREDKS